MYKWLFDVFTRMGYFCLINEIFYNVYYIYNVALHIMSTRYMMRTQ